MLSLSPETSMSKLTFTTSQWKRIKISPLKLHEQRSGSTAIDSLSYLDQFLIRIGSFVSTSVGKFVVTHWHRLPREVIEIISTNIQILTGRDLTQTAVGDVELGDIHESHPTTLDCSVILWKSSSNRRTIIPALDCVYTVNNPVMNHLNVFSVCASS